MAYVLGYNYGLMDLHCLGSQDYIAIERGGTSCGHPLTTGTRPQVGGQPHGLGVQGLISHRAFEFIQPMNRIAEAFQY